jgi:Protein of unknown function (DUF2905)
MSDVGKILVLVGIGLVVVSALIWFSGKLNLPLGRLPWDIRIERGNFKFYFPLATCLLISAVLTLVMWLLHRK